MVSVGIEVNIQVVWSQVLLQQFFSVSVRKLCFENNYSSEKAADFLSEPHSLSTLEYACFSFGIFSQSAQRDVIY